MTNTLISRSLGRQAAQLAIALTVGLGLLMPMPVVAEPMPASAKVRPFKSHKHHRRGDVTVIIIDKDKHKRSRSSVPVPQRDARKSRTITATSGRIERDDDDTRIIIRQTRNTSGAGKTHHKTGPKVIVVDRDSGSKSDCNGGVCVIRP